jgi:hypothetical protein
LIAVFCDLPSLRLKIEVGLTGGRVEVQCDVYSNKVFGVFSQTMNTKLEPFGSNLMDSRHNNQTSKMADEFVKPVVCVCSEEVITALADYGRNSLALREALKVAKKLLLTVFPGRSQMVNSRDEILFHLRLSLTEEEQEIFRLTDLFVGKQGQTVEQKALIVERKKFGRKLARVFLELLNGVFPVDDDDENPFKSPSPAATPITSPVATPIDSATKTGGFSFQ